MFSKKINKKIAESKRRSENATHLNLTREQITNVHRQFETDHPDQESLDSPFLSPQQRSKSRIVAGFNSIQNDDPRQNYRSNRDDQRPLQRSTNELIEEYDAENLQYPIQDYPSREHLIDYNEQLNLSNSRLAKPQMYPPTLPPTQSLEPQPGPSSFTQAIYSSSSKMLKPIEKLKKNPINLIDSSSEQLNQDSSTLFPKYLASGSSTGQSQRVSMRPSGNFELNRQPRILEQGPLTLDSFDSSFNNSLINMEQNSNSNANANINYPIINHSRQLNSNPSFNYTPFNLGRYNLNMNSRDVIPLPIEIPDSVTDTDAFRRYLSVRRGASPFMPESHDNEEEELNLPLGSRGSRRDSMGSQILGDTLSNHPSRKFSALNKPINLPGGPSGDGTCPPTGGDCNQSQYLKKTTSLSHAIMTLALLSASAAQLRFVVAYSHVHSYPTLNYFLICSCIIIEVLVGIGFVILARFDFQESFVDRIHSYLIFGLFIVTIANVIVAAFALDTRVFSKTDCHLQNDPKRVIDPDLINGEFPRNVGVAQIQ